MNGIEDAMDDLDSVGLGLSGVFSPLDYKPQHQVRVINGFIPTTYYTILTIITLLKEDNDTWIITILAGVFGMAGGMLTGALGRFTEGNGFQAAINADAAAGMSSGLTTIINGMENALITTESDAYVYTTIQAQFARSIRLTYLVALPRASRSSTTK
ncbi:hypothetical protein N7474_010293 [Penicillium riverlandense]|uniref:uncharacterized protein n=1 Tax=Penicillium riverlandense TaxID=1903569 RepID=UPI0025480760|nr:uncharacterized protein N7474_010293 [Penicillium riverlandense]KAJ5806701.1 hypothetical protein N7474_010293 [Penicillium riverlandense]